MTRDGGDAGVGLDRLVDLVSRHLGFDAVLVAEMEHDRFVLAALAGETSGLPLAVGAELPEDERAYYAAILGRAARDSAAAAARRSGSSAAPPGLRSAGFNRAVSVPLRFSDGSVYGILSGLVRTLDRRPAKLERRFMAMLAELIAGDLDEQRRRQRLKVAILDVIEHQRIEIAYQPIVDLRSGRIIGVEALSRFPEPFTRPDETFAAAEEVGLGLELERLAISTAWPVLDLLDPPLFLTINISPASLVRLARRATERPELSIDNLVVEITEHAIVEHYEELRQELAPLRERGLRVAIDDAGAGYASLQHVVELQPDFVKVDTALVRGVADDHARRVAISAFVLLSLDLGATVIAEGAETPRDLTTLGDLGVHAAQGYLLGTPTGVEEILRRLRTPHGD